MILQPGDILTATKRLRIEVINSANNTVLITNLDTKKSEIYSWEMLQSLDSVLNFEVTKAQIEKE